LPACAAKIAATTLEQDAPLHESRGSFVWAPPPSCAGGIAFAAR